jgi:hypothetical protein
MGLSMINLERVSTLKNKKSEEVDRILLESWNSICKGNAIGTSVVLDCLDFVVFSIQKHAVNLHLINSMELKPALYENITQSHLILALRICLFSVTDKIREV